MPVQINEVIVKAVINSNSKENSDEADCPPSGNSGTENELAEKILEILREKKER
jgi:hypothetical protein